MGINKWRLIEPSGNEDPGSAQCMMCKETCYEQYDMKFCPFCGTQWEGQLECSEKGRKWEDMVRKYGRSIYDNRRCDKSCWSVQWKLTDLANGEKCGRDKWAKERCFNRYDAVVKYKDKRHELEGSTHFWEVRLVRVTKDLLIKQVLTSGAIGGKIRDGN